MFVITYYVCARVFVFMLTRRRQICIVDFFLSTVRYQPTRIKVNTALWISVFRAVGLKWHCRGEPRTATLKLRSYGAIEIWLFFRI